ncbi:MAG: tetratricopeptide repeat protein [Candidatus Omnitrophota bacterium]
MGIIRKERSFKSGFFYLLVVLVLTAAAFLPSLSNGFVDFDDPSYVINNTLIRSFSPANLDRIFRSAFVGCYCPLAVISYSAEYRLFGLNAFFYHLTNYLLHLSVTAAVFFFIYKLSASRRAAFIVSVLFGIHPMHVESVAWISERKDLLCALFYILALISYLRYLDIKRRRHYILSILYFVLALFSKPMAVTVPLVLILLDHFCGRDLLSIRSLLEKAPFFIASAVFTVINISFQSASGATGLVATPGVKIYFLLKAIPFYLAKIFAPVNLSAMYLYHNINAAHSAEVKYYLAVLALLLLAVIFFGRRSKEAIFGTLFFLMTVLPVLKIVPAGDCFAADRYMYIPSIGVFYLAAVFFGRLLESKFGIARWGAVFLLSAVIIILASLTWQRCGVWKDTETLYMDVLKRYPDRAPLYNDLGAHFAERGDLDKAIRCFGIALAFYPDYKAAKENLASTMEDKRLRAVREEGEPAFKARLEGAKDAGEKVKLLNEMGLAEGQSNDIDKAIALFREAAELDPSYAESYNNLGFSYYLKGDVAGAEGYFRKALELDPGHKNAKRNLDFILSHKEDAERVVKK